MFILSIVLFERLSYIFSSMHLWVSQWRCSIRPSQLPCVSILNGVRLLVLTWSRPLPDNGSIYGENHGRSRRKNGSQDYQYSANDVLDPWSDDLIDVSFVSTCTLLDHGLTLCFPLQEKFSLLQCRKKNDVSTCWKGATFVPSEGAGYDRDPLRVLTHTLRFFSSYWGRALKETFLNSTANDLTLK